MLTLRLLACTMGKHEWKNGGSIGYAGYEEGTRTCEVCGQDEKTFGSKSYQPPYWHTGSRVIRPGRYPGAPEAGTRSFDGVYESRAEKAERERLSVISEKEYKKNSRLRKIASLKEELRQLESDNEEELRNEKSEEDGG